MKYVVLKQDGHENYYIFNKTITHRDFARKNGGEVISAGFVDGLENAKLFGESISLQSKSRPEDTEKFRYRADQPY